MAHFMTTAYTIINDYLDGKAAYVNYSDNSVKSILKATEKLPFPGKRNPVAEQVHILQYKKNKDYFDVWIVYYRRGWKRAEYRAYYVDGTPGYVVKFIRHNVKHEW